jgi:pimeloyl-ACP methyl ester carboxylesterase
MSKLYAVACKGLADPLVAAPLERLVAFLNLETGIFFNLVGGIDPHPLFEIEILNPLIEAYGRGETVIFLGHSMGAMAAFIAADRLKALGIKSPLFVAIDATDWASNAPGVIPWTRAPANLAGKWYVPDNIDEFYYFHQSAYPGGGVAELEHGNTHTKFHTYFMPQESHIGIVNNRMVQKTIVDALRMVP